MEIPRRIQDLSLYVENFLKKEKYIIVSLSLHKKDFEVICRINSSHIIVIHYGEKYQFTYRSTYNKHVDSMCDRLCLQFNHALICLQGL